MKNRLYLLLFAAVAVSVFALWNNEAVAQPNTPVEKSAIPMNRMCIITVDAKSNSRASMSQEMQIQSGFCRQDTVQGRLMQLTAEWIVLKDDNAENWIPRDKVLLMRVAP